LTSDGRYLVYAAGGNVVTWDIARQAIHQKVPVPPVPADELFGYSKERKAEISGFALNPDGSVALLATQSRFGPILWDVRRGARVATFDNRVTMGDDVAFSRDGRTFASMAQESGTTQVVDVTRRMPVRTFTGHWRGREAVVTLSADGRTVAAAGADETIALFQVDSLGALPIIPKDAVFTADGTRLITASSNYGIQVWDVAQRTPVGPVTALFTTEYDRQFGQVAISPDGRLVAAHGGRLKKDWKTVVWDVERRIPLGAPIAGDVSSLVFSPDGRMLAWVDRSRGEVVVWDVAGRKRIAVLPDQSSEVSLSFGPGGRLAIAAGLEGMFLWDIAGAPPVEPWLSQPVAEVTFSSDGHWLVAQHLDGIGLWNVPERKLEATLPGHLTPTVFSPDSGLLASHVLSASTSGFGSENVEVVISDVKAGNSVATLDIGDFAGTESLGLRFSPDSKMLVSTGKNGVTLQRIDTSWAEQHLCQIVQRDMTEEEWKEFLPGRTHKEICP
jgi:WD40 repeat protein